MLRRDAAKEDGGPARVDVAIDPASPSSEGSVESLGGLHLLRDFFPALEVVPSPHFAEVRPPVAGVEDHDVGASPEASAGGEIVEMQDLGTVSLPLLQLHQERTPKELHRAIVIL